LPEITEKCDKTLYSNPAFVVRVSRKCQKAIISIGGILVSLGSGRNLREGKVVVGLFGIVKDRLLQVT
jgi:hypothetical protein